MLVRVLPVRENGREEDRREETPSHTPEQIVRKLCEADRIPGEGVEVPEVCTALEVSEATYHR